MSGLEIAAVSALVGSTAISAAGTLAAGKAEKQSAFAQAQQMNQQAGQERAAAQRVALQNRREANVAASRATALAAASGGSATDPTATKIISDITGQGEFNALTSLYNGEERARGMEYGAKAKIAEGSNAKKASQTKALGTILSTASTLYGRFGNGGPPPVEGGSQLYGPSNLPWQNTPGYRVPNYG